MCRPFIIIDIKLFDVWMDRRFLSGTNPGGSSPTCVDGGRVVGSTSTASGSFDAGAYALRGFWAKKSGARQVQLVVSMRVHAIHGGWARNSRGRAATHNAARTAVALAMEVGFT